MNHISSAVSTKLCPRIELVTFNTEGCEKDKFAVENPLRVTVILTYISNLCQYTYKGAHKS